MSGDEPSFLNDLRAAAAAWVRLPWLPMAAIAFTFALDLFDGPAWPVGLVAAIIYAGWLGTERISYLRVYRRQSITFRELWPMTRSFVLRYAFLGAVFALLIAPASIVFASAAPAGRPADIDGFLLYAGVVAFVFGVTCTFITPALAFTTRRVGQAARIGLRIIRNEWPACGGYVLIPPLVSFAIVRSVGPWNETELMPRLFALTCAPLLSLLFKGATASFYLRHRETGNDGAAFISRAAPLRGPKPPGDVPQ